MSFEKILDDATQTERDALIAAPSLQAALAGNVTLDSYVSFLEQAYHHVKHTAPILMAAGSRLRPHQGQYLGAIAEYIEEEIGHDEWILNDIEKCGKDKEAVRNGEPSPACELFVSYLYDRVQRINPLSVFGMVYVLEGTSIQYATLAAQQVGTSLDLPSDALSYLLSHGELDQDHYAFFRKLLTQMDSEEDRRDILHTAQRAFPLYRRIFETLDWSPLRQVA